MNTFFARYNSWLGMEVYGKEDAFPPHTFIRVNSLKIRNEELVKRLKKKKVELKKVQYLRHGYEAMKSAFSLGAAPEYLLGYYYLQDALSQLPAEVLGPLPGERVLDMCSAPGGKGTQISQLMENTGVMVMLESHHSRLLSLKNNMERLGVSNGVIIEKDARYVSELGMIFDRVLLDAPCSGNFVLEKGWHRKRSMADFKEKAKIQKQLLSAACSVVKDGGIVVYSTCSLEIEENEEVIEWALEHCNVVLEKIKVGVGSAGLTEKTRLCKRFWPHETGTQGFFIAKLRKNQ